MISKERHKNIYKNSIYIKFKIMRNYIKNAYIMVKPGRKGKILKIFFAEEGMTKIKYIGDFWNVSTYDF